MIMWSEALTTNPGPQCKYEYLQYTVNTAPADPSPSLFDVVFYTKVKLTI